MPNVYEDVIAVDGGKLQEALFIAAGTLRGEQYTAGDIIRFKFFGVTFDIASHTNLYHLQRDFLRASGGVIAPRIGPNPIPVLSKETEDFDLHLMNTSSNRNGFAGYTQAWQVLMLFSNGWNASSGVRNYALAG